VLLERLKLGQSRRWRFEPTASAMESLPDIDQEISPTGSFVISPVVGPDP